MFRTGRDQDGAAVEILRLLHDAMDLPRHPTPIDEAK